MNSSTFVGKCIEVQLFPSAFFKVFPLFLEELGCCILCKRFLSTLTDEHLAPQKLALSHPGKVNSLNIHEVACWSWVVEELSQDYLASTLLSILRWLSERKLAGELGWRVQPRFRSSPGNYRKRGVLVRENKHQNSTKMCLKCSGIHR